MLRTIVVALRRRHREDWVGVQYNGFTSKAVVTSSHCTLVLNGPLRLCFPFILSVSDTAHQRRHAANYSSPCTTHHVLARLSNGTSPCLITVFRSRPY